MFTSGIYNYIVSLVVIIVQQWLRAVITSITSKLLQSLPTFLIDLIFKDLREFHKTVCGADSSIILSDFQQLEPFVVKYFSEASEIFKALLSVPTWDSQDFVYQRVKNWKRNISIQFFAWLPLNLSRFFSSN